MGKYPTPKSIGAAIRRIRESKNLDAKDIGIYALGYPMEKAEAAQRKVSRIECGDQKYPRLEELIRIATFLDVPLEEIIRPE